MPFRIIRNDIAKTKAAAIVNTANPKPKVGSGVDTGIYNAAGYDALLEERKKIGDIAVGDVVATSSFKLNAKYIFHAVSPAWQGGNAGEKETLSALYKKCLELAVQKNCESIAFPLLASGNYRFPKDIAIQIAIKEFGAFLLLHDIEIILVVYDSDSLCAGEKIFPEVEKFIDDNYIKEKKHKLFDKARSNRIDSNKAESYARASLGTTFSSAVIGSVVGSEDVAFAKPRKPIKTELSEEIKNAGKPFDEYLRNLMNKKQMTSVDICRRGNIDRKYFSKLISNKITPSKQKLLSLAVSLELNFDETTDLLKYMGYAFSDNDITDLIFRFYIQNSNYNIYEINTVLFQHDQKVLFGEE